MVSNSDDGYIGRLSGSTGEVTVDGAGSEWTNGGYLRVDIDASGSDLEDYTVLTVGPATIPPTGDFDLDGDCDGVDFLIWQRGESPYPLSQSDFYGSNGRKDFDGVSEILNSIRFHLPRPRDDDRCADTVLVGRTLGPLRVVFP